MTPQYQNEISDGAAMVIALSARVIKRLFVGLLACSVLSLIAALIVAFKEPQVVVVTDSGNLFELQTIVGEERSALVEKYESTSK